MTDLVGFYLFLANQLDLDALTQGRRHQVDLGRHVSSDRYELVWVREDDGVTYTIFWALLGPEKFLLGTPEAESRVYKGAYRHIDLAAFEVRTDADRRELVSWVRKNRKGLLTGALPRGFSS